MRKIVVLIYDLFYNFEFSVALEILALSEKKITIFRKTKALIKSEDRLTVVPNES